MIIKKGGVTLCFTRLNFWYIFMTFYLVKSSCFWWIKLSVYAKYIERFIKAIKFSFFSWNILLHQYCLWKEVYEGISNQYSHGSSCRGATEIGDLARQVGCAPPWRLRVCGGAAVAAGARLCSAPPPWWRTSWPAAAWWPCSHRKAATQRRTLPRGDAPPRRSRRQGEPRTRRRRRRCARTAPCVGAASWTSHTSADTTAMDRSTIFFFLLINE